MKRPTTIVCTGGGGVGKTTTSAALALALARRGRRVLVVSLDPARRLADALGAELGTEARELAVDAGPGTLFGLMPDPKTALESFVDILAEDDTEVMERLRDNTVYRALEASVPGLHELVAINLTWRAAQQHHIDTVVVDTAPSRNAVDFITYPRRLAQLLGSRAIGWMTGLGKRSESTSFWSRMSKVEKLLVWAIGPVVSDVAEFFTELANVRERFVWLNDQVDDLLSHPETHYFLVAAPTSAARDDADYLMKRLKALKLSPRAFILNSSYVPESEWLEVLDGANVDSADLRAVLGTLKEERAIREDASAAVSAAFSQRHPSLPQHRLPYVEVQEPRHIVLTLSQQLSGSSLLPA